MITDHDRRSATSTTARVLLLIAAASSLAGCGCSIYRGEGDKVFARGNDALILCTNGGYVINAATSFEGHHLPAPAGSAFGEIATKGETGARLFTISNQGGALSTPELGAELWEPLTLDKTALDHADVQCTDLASRPWWGYTITLPVPTAFASPADGYPTVDACHAAQLAGDYPTDSRCEFQLELCVDRLVSISLANDVILGVYESHGGQVAANASDLMADFSFSGMFKPDGTLTPDNNGPVRWTQIAQDRLAPEVHCTP